MEKIIHIDLGEFLEIPLLVMQQAFEENQNNGVDIFVLNVDGKNITFNIGTLSKSCCLVDMLQEAGYVGGQLD